MSRHLYDIERMIDTPFAEIALTNRHLYQSIVEHRRTITPIRGINYDNHAPNKINPIPPANLLEEWRKDYQQMQQSMIYGESLPFAALIKRITELKNRINALEYE